MDRLVSSDFYNILSKISDQKFDPEHIFSVFRAELPAFAKKYGFVLFKASIYEPVKRSSQMNITEVELYNATNGEETNSLELEYPTGNGGRVVIIAGLNKDAEWTKELKEDNYVISRLIYLLVGRAKTMASLQHLMFYDQMTGIANETSLGRYMSRTISQNRFVEYCTNFLNIKNMKLINNRYGEEAGDAVLLGYANAVDSYIKEKNCGIVARLGGDNFLIFIEKKFQNDFLEFARSIVIPYTKRNGDTIDIVIESRIGYYYINPGDGISESMRNADVASKLARSNNYPDYVEFEESMKIHILKMRQLEQNVPDAIKNREFVVYYQAKADISSKDSYRTNGAEALVRWIKDGEIISPADFIPVLEKSGLVTYIDYYVLEQVCIDINSWIEQGIEPVKISSNFSRRHLQDKKFADNIEAIIRKHNVDPKYIEIEITESYDDEDVQALKIFENRMHELGVSLAVDDFGCGFSSIKMIKDIFADTIKLDKSMIDGIGDGGPDDIIISHIIRMINCLGKEVIAEGVESEKQAAFLRENGCNSIQGFLYSRPCPKAEFEKYLK